MKSIMAVSGIVNKDREDLPNLASAMFTLALAPITIDIMDIGRSVER
jgi:hypothetical protein